jgi:hypothetical protein
MAPGGCISKGDHPVADSTGEQPPSLTVRVTKIFRSKEVTLTLGRGRVQL